MKHLVVTAITLAALSGCARNDPTQSSFFREAGASLDDGGFGNATMNNVLAQTNDEGFRINLQHRFSGEVQSTINFAFNSTALDEEARAALRQQANWINQFPEVHFKVYGHTDLVGSTAYNRRLGLARAQAAVLYLTSQGVSRSRLEAVVSFGETQPLIVTEGQERRNRRTVTEVAGFIQNNSLVLNGKYAEIIFRDYVTSAAAPSTVAQPATAGGSGGGGGGSGASPSSGG
jgi:peptidoglycan-associated lipoprotein